MAGPVASDTETGEGGEAETGLKQTYLDAIRLIERLHRRFLDVVKSELDRLGMEDINNVQAVLLTNIETESLTIGELTNRGYYMGSNVSYNVKKLTDLGYLEQERSAHDKRSVTVWLTDKALDVVTSMTDLQDYNSRAFMLRAANAQDPDAINGLFRGLRSLERTWSDYIHYGVKEKDSAPTIQQN